MSTVRQVYVPDVFRKFADALDERGANPVAYDMGRVKLTAMLDALGKFALMCGVSLRLEMQQIGPLTVEPFLYDGKVVGSLTKYKLTDELRRFADMLERRPDAVRKADPGMKRLADALKAMSIYAGWMGVDLGIGRGYGAIVNRPLPVKRR